MLKGMEKTVVFLAVLCAAFRASVEEGNWRKSSDKAQMLLQEKLELLNKPAVKTIQSEDGDIIDCVDIYKQPAFDHPLFKNYTIKTPSFDEYIRAKVEEASSSSSSSSSSESNKNISVEVTQAWRKNGTCPERTIPIRRVQMHRLQIAKNIERYGMKNMHEIKKYEFRGFNRTYVKGIENFHAYAALFTAGYSYTGAKGFINLWNPRVEADDEYSTGQIWLRYGPFNDSNSIEVGWMVNPSLYGDRRTRLFIYWTNDNGKTTGCFDLLCPGFIQTNKDIAIGAAFDTISSTFGPQYVVPLEVIRDFDKDVWWLNMGNTTLGYWEAKLFTYLDRIAEIVEWGGNVYTPRLRSKPHTQTAMGSGEFANMHFGYAAFIQQPRVRDYSLTYKYPEPFFPFAPTVDCYSAENFARQLWTEPLFFFGGPGRNMYCE